MNNMGRIHLRGWLVTQAPHPSIDMQERQARHRDIINGRPSGGSRFVITQSIIWWAADTGLDTCFRQPVKFNNAIALDESYFAHTYAAFRNTNTSSSSTTGSPRSLRRRCQSESG